MGHEVQWPTLQRTELVNVSFCGFTFWWFIILGIHLTTSAYNLVYAIMYWGFEETTFSFILEYHEIGISSKYNHTIAFVFIALAAVHGICALLMIVGSLRHRKLVFLPRRKICPSSIKIIHVTSATKLDVGQPETEVSSRTATVVRFLSSTYHRVGSEHGVLGVKGKHFHVILTCREVVEMALQTTQAIQMSKYLPRLVLNRFYVSLLAINCCSSGFVYSRWFSRSEARRRFAAVVCDCVLNLMSTIGVSLIIMLSYTDDYDIASFRWELFDDDDWIARTLNELRVVLVVSWSDLAARVIFSLSLVAATVDMKALMEYSPKRNKQIVTTATSGEPLNEKLEPFPHEVNLSTREVTADTTPRKEAQAMRIMSSYKSTGLESRKSRFILRGMHGLFAVWGVVLLALHLHASKQTPLHECAPEVFPMAGALPSCYAVQFNCHTLGFSATKTELATEWQRFDRTTAVKLRILHCPSFEMPETFQDFRTLQEVFIYNSTILGWDDTAAITNTHHPMVRSAAVVRTNMTGGFLPLGFQSQDFPVLIPRIVFCETNLETLPDDLNWPTGFNVLIENSKLTSVPSALVRVQPHAFALTGNPLTDLQPELFGAGVEFLSVGNTHINELPHYVISTVLTYLDITNTNISSFPLWMDTLIDMTSKTSLFIYAGGSPYCLDLEDIMNGDATSFRAPFHPDDSLVLMNASKGNWELLQQIVYCLPALPYTQYPLDYVDASYALESGDDVSELHR